MSITFNLENITPNKSEKLLADTEAAGFNNRTPTKAFINRYAGDIEKRHWQSNTGETIKIASNGAVIDGQHRLHAVIQSGIAVKMWVCRGIKPEMFQYIDQGNKRDLKDLMSIEGWEDPVHLGVVGKMLWRLDRTTEMGLMPNPYAHAGKFNESDGNIFDWVQTIEPDLRRDWVSYKPLIRKAYNQSHKAVPESLLYYLFYVWRKEDADAAHLFLGYLSEGPLGTPSHNAMALFKEFAIEAQIQQKAGKLAGKGRHADLKEQLLKAADHAWHLIQKGGNSVRTLSGFKSGMANRANHQEGEAA